MTDSSNVWNEHGHGPLSHTHVQYTHVHDQDSSAKKVDRAKLR
jgi:hypothetical protein